MKKIILLILLLFSLIAVSGCGRFMGDGQQVGYISAVDNNVFWAHVYIKPTLESTQEDIYIIQKGSSLLNELRTSMVNKQRIRVNYVRHFWTFASSEEEITNYEVLN